MASIKSQTDNYRWLSIFFVYKKQKVFEEKRLEFDLAERIEFPSVIDDATKNQSKTNTFVTFFWHVIHAHDDSEINFLAFRLTRWVASHRTMHTIWKFIFGNKASSKSLHV